MRRFQSTLPTRGSANREAVTTANTSISIHAPHEGERHLCGFSLILCNYNFNPRSPRGGATPPSNIKGNSHSPFQSTLPARGSDTNNTYLTIHRRHFNPRSPQGGATCSAYRICKGTAYFNPRSPQGGATSFGFIISLTVSNFNPRSPQGGATPLVTIPCNALDISIHAPRKGERLTVLCFVISTTNFNPRSPQGGATKLICLQQHLWRISIHAPRKGERRREADRALAYIKISIHAPHKGERLILL